VSKASSNRGERGVHVAVDEHQVGPNLGADRLEPLHHGGGLRRLGARADPEVVVGSRDPKLLEERVRHARIVRVPGVHDDMLDARAPRKLPVHRRELHEVRAGLDDGEDTCHGDYRVRT